METSVGACRQQMPPATFVPDPNGNYCPMAAGHKRHGPGGTGETHRKPLRGGRARVQSRLLHSFLVTGADGPRLQAGSSPRGTVRIYARLGPIRRNNGFPIGSPGAAPLLNRENSPGQAGKNCPNGPGNNRIPISVKKSPVESQRLAGFLETGPPLATLPTNFVRPKVCQPNLGL